MEHPLKRDMTLVNTDSLPKELFSEIKDKKLSNLFTLLSSTLYSSNANSPTKQEVRELELFMRVKDVIGSKGRSNVPNNNFWYGNKKLLTMSLSKKPKWMLKHTVFRYKVIEILVW